jgi:NADPH:quinone reductase-like Zn-dependent oxidoreductase
MSAPKKLKIWRPIRWSRWILGFLLLAIGAFALTISHTSACPPAVDSARGDATMQAIRSRCYGAAPVLRLEHVAKPVPEDDMLLVRVRAAGVNPLDWHMMRGEPYILRMDAGIGSPKDARMGVDFSGTVEAVGKAVTKFKPGDEVFGGSKGSFGEYVRIRESGAVALKPANVTHQQAAAVPIAAVTALQALRDQGKLKAGEKVLVNGASGGVGSYAVQIAKAMGAEVTAVCSTRNVSMVASLGADRVLDYTAVDYTAGDARYDLIVDAVGNRNLRDMEKVLAPGGIAVMVGGTGRDPWIGPLTVPIKIMAYGPFTDREFKFFIAGLNQADLAWLAGLMQSGHVISVIDRTYPLAQAPDAVAYVEEGHARGKVVVTVD